MKSEVSIIVPTYNRAGLLKPTLESIKALRIPQNTTVEIIVVDNNCTDSTKEVVEKAGGKSMFSIRRVIETEQGLSHGRNRGLKEAAFEHVVFLDDDILVSPDWLVGYFEAVDKLNADCVVGPVFPIFETELPNYLTPRILESITSSYSRKGEEIMRLPSDVAHELPGCNFGVKKKEALEIGGFDPSFGRKGKGLLAGDDTDFGFRLVAENKRIIHHPKCSIQHVITADKISKDYLRRRWYGAGMTVREFHKRRGGSIPFLRRLRYALGIGWMWITSRWLRQFSEPGKAFQRELETLRAIGYLRGA